MLEWVQDGNWPVADGIFKVLVKYTNDIKYQLITVLNGQDDDWKYWCIIGIIGMTEQWPVDHAIVRALERIAKYPTEQEAFHEMDRVAQDTLHTLTQ